MVDTADKLMLAYNMPKHRGKLLAYFYNNSLTKIEEIEENFQMTRNYIYVTLHRLRSHLIPYGIEVAVQRGAGIFLTPESRTRIHEALREYDEIYGSSADAVS